MTKLVVLDVVGLTPRLLAHMPRLRAVGSSARLDPVLPAVTCSVQATLLTGETPAGRLISWGSPAPTAQKPSWRAATNPPAARGTTAPTWRPTSRTSSAP